MSEIAKKLKNDPSHTDGYKPQSIPNALKVIQSNVAKEINKKERIDNMLEAIIVTKDEFNVIALKATGSMKDFELGKDVRRAWGELQKKINPDDSVWSEKEIGYVFYSQGNMKRTDGKLELRIGVRVESFDDIPPEVEKIIIPKRKYAMISCRCHGHEQMDQTYRFLSQWIEKEGLEVDYSTDAFTLEPNRLSLINPFDIPADEILDFDFDILYPIK